MKPSLTIILLVFCQSLFAQQHVAVSQTVSLRLNKITTMSLMIGNGTGLQQTSAAARGNILPHEVSLGTENTSMKARANADLVYSSEPVVEAPVYMLGGKGAVLPDPSPDLHQLITVSSR